MTTTQKLWVLFKSNDSSVFNYPTQVPTKDYENVDDFIDAIKKKLSNELRMVDPHRIALHLPEDSTALRPGFALNSIISQPGFINNDETPLIVYIPLLSTPSSGPLMKAGRQKTLKKMSVEASCRTFLDTVAFKLSIFYTFPQAYQGGPTIGDVFSAVDPTAQHDDEEGPLWTFRKEQRTHWRMDCNNYRFKIKKGDQLTSVPLPDVFTPDEWAKLSNFNREPTSRIHDGSMPLLSDDRPFIAISHAEMVEFFQTLQTLEVGGKG